MKFSEKVWSDHGATWFNSGKRVGGSKVKFFDITDHSSESVAFARGRDLLCPASQLVDSLKERIILHKMMYL